MTIKKVVRYPSLSSQIIENLMISIKEGKFKSNRLPPERKLAEAYNVSRKTLREALTVLEKKGLLYPVRGKGTFLTPPLRIKEPYRKASKNIGFILCLREAFLDPYHSLTFAGVEAETKKQGYNLLYASVNSKLVKGRVEIPKMVRERSVEGVILSGKVSPAFASAIKSSGPPLVLLGHLTSEAKIEEQLDRVVVDSQKYGYQATKYLLQLGHQRIALVNGPSLLWFLNIVKGYKQTLEEFHLDSEEDLMQNCSDDQESDGYMATKRLLKLSKKPTAIFVANERLAMGVIAAIKDAHLKIPQDISVMSVLDTELAQKAEPPLTTVRIPGKEIGRRGVILLMERIKKRKEPPIVITIPTKIIARETCRSLS